MRLLVEIEIMLLFSGARISVILERGLSFIVDTVTSGKRNIKMESVQYTPIRWFRSLNKQTNII